MGNIKRQIVILSLVIFVAGCGHLKGEPRNMLISKKKAVEISTGEANRLGYNTSLMNVTIDNNNTLWTKYSSSLNLSTGVSLLNEISEVKNRLKNRTFWAVHFGPKNIEQQGGDLWVFIDRNTGEVILYLKGY
jgi:hypothetical protein